MKTVSRFQAVLALGLSLTFSAHAQWLTQSFQLQPGWNAVFFHVDASYSSLDDLIPDANSPVAEIWLWKPSYSTLQFVDSPQKPIAANSQWAVWTAARGDTDTLVRLVGNTACLVRNATDSPYTWTVKGKAVAPSYQWTSTGLNLIGFPTPSSNPPALDAFLAPAPGLDLAKSAANQAQVFRYIGGDLANNPTNVLPPTAHSVLVNRGEAFWVRAATNYYNRYYGPFELALQNPAGLDFRDNVGVYSFRLRNLTDTRRVVTCSQVDSETPPAGQTNLAGSPQLLLRGSLNISDLTFGHTLLHGSQLSLEPQGQEGSEIEVVIGLNRSVMNAPAGSLYAGILRLTDADGLSQVDLPVRAAVPSLAGLWVGDANISQVGEYLKSYPKLTASAPAPRSSYLRFDGSAGYAQLPAGVYFTNSGFTVESWVNVRTIRTWSRLFDFGNGPAADNVLLPFSFGGSGAPTFGTYRSGQAASLVSWPLVTLNAWVHLAVVQQAGPEGGSALTTIYLNGAKMAEGSQFVPRNVTRSRCYLGKSNWDADALADAGIDDFRIWSAPRGAEDIRRDMFIDNYPAGTPSLLVQYNFSDPQKPGADSSGNEIDLALNGGAILSTDPMSEAESVAANMNRSLSLSQRTPNNWELPGASWVPAATEPDRNYVDVASSQDGNRLLAAAAGSAGILVLSTNAGASWFTVDPSGGTTKDWRAVAVAASGQVLAAAASSGGLWVSTDGGGSWSERTPPGARQSWSALAAVANGSELIATASPGLVYFSFDSGRTWSPMGVAKNWTSIAASEDGLKVWLSAANDTLYYSGDGGRTWAPVGLRLNWSSVACSTDARSVVAMVQGGQIAVSTDGGLGWTVREKSRAWRRAACSSDGRQMVAVANGGAIYVSPDAGASWFPQESDRSWQAVASSADGGRLVAVVGGGNVFTRSRAFARYSFDADTGLIRSSDGAYLSSGVNTNMARVARPFPLRLILHGDSTNVNLLQRVFVGPSALSSNTIIAGRESLLDSRQLGAARRLSAVHLPFSTNNTFWSSFGQLTPGSVLSFTVPIGYSDQASNPFLHTFHPDHDNLTPDFKAVQPEGYDSYGITRQIQLTLAPAGTDFRSLTSSQLNGVGVYEETITLRGKEGATRQYRTAGSFTIQRISSIPTLTTQ